jgi:hypothetical protein
MITKKVGKITYAWSEHALNGKGWWFELGANGGLGLAATRAIGSKLGKPKATDMPPKNANKYYFATTKSGKPIKKRYKTAGMGDDGPSQYEIADVNASKSLSRLASERLLSGEGIGASLKNAFKDKIGVKATNLKKKFDPLNMLSKISPLAATAYGMKRGRSLSDISYFTGIQGQPPEKPQEEEDSAPTRRSRKQTATKATKSATGGLEKGSAGTLKQIYKLLSDKFEEDTKLREVDKNFEEERKTEDEKRHKELLDAILKGKGKKEEKKKEEKTTLMDMLMGAFSMLKSLPGMIMGGLSSLLGLKSLSKLGGKAIKGVANLGKSIVKGGVKLATKAGSMIKGGVKAAMGFGSKAASGVGSLVTKGAEAAEKAGSALAKGGKIATKVAGAGGKLLKGGGKLLGFLKGIPGLSLITAGADLIMRIKEVNDKKESGEISDADYKKEITKAIGSAAAAGLLPILGGAIGSVVPGVGTVIGGLGGAAAALLGGDKIGGWLAGKMYDFFIDDKKGTASQVKKDSATPVGTTAGPGGAEATSQDGLDNLQAQQMTDAAKGAKASQVSSTPTSSTRMNDAVTTNQSLVGPAATQRSQSAPIITNSTQIVNGGGNGGGGGGTPMGMRNEEPILMRVQYGNVKAV